MSDKLNCKNCNKEITGRADKQWCSRRCRYEANQEAEQHKSKLSQRNYRHSNKENINAKRREKYRLNTSEYTSVYYLPEEHYVGITNNVQHRMNTHRNQHNRIIEGYEIIAKFERVVDAVWFEALLHQRGYNGCQFS